LSAPSLNCLPLEKRLTGGEICKTRISPPAETRVPTVNKAQAPCSRAFTAVVGRQAVGVESHTGPENYMVDARNLDQEFFLNRTLKDVRLCRTNRRHVA
jgi:hypothetical protein